MDLVKGHAINVKCGESLKTSLVLGGLKEPDQKKKHCSTFFCCIKAHLDSVIFPYIFFQSKWTQVTVKQSLICKQSATYRIQSIALEKKIKYITAQSYFIVVLEECVFWGHMLLQCNDKVLCDSTQSWHTSGRAKACQWSKGCLLDHAWLVRGRVGRDGTGQCLE